MRVVLDRGGLLRASAAVAVLVGVGFVSGAVLGASYAPSGRLDLPAGAEDARMAGGESVGDGSESVDEGSVGGSVTSDGAAPRTGSALDPRH